MTDRKIIMAVDFGTTYSGMAWAQTRKPEIQSPIVQWPDATSGGLEGITSDKVPSEIKYHGEGLKWGFQIGDYGERHQWFKLGLDPAQSTNAATALAREYSDPNASPPAYNPETLVTDYLTALRKHAEEVLRHKLPGSALASIPIEYVITTPAVWSDLAQAKTRSCAQKAGMGVGSALHIISEPEAAAMYALDAMDPHNIQVGDTFVLCDAGGGTVDLISYKVSALKPFLQIAEAAPGSGSSCGSTFLNRIFQKFLKDKLGSDPNWDEGELEEAMKRFEVTVKRSFSDSPGEEYQIPGKFTVAFELDLEEKLTYSAVPGLGDSVTRGVRRGRYRLTRSDVRSIFDPVVKEVLALIKGQIAATKVPVKAVLLVGGFGQNTYLRNQVRQTIGRRGVEVMQSPNGWTAVVRGALMKGLASTNHTFARVSVSGRCARKHHGILSNKSYDPIKFPLLKKRRYWSACEGNWRICTIDWFIKKGETIEENKPKRLPYYRTILCSEGLPSKISAPILACSDPHSSGAPMLKNNRVVTLVNVTADFGVVATSHFPTIVGKDQKLYYKLSYEIEVTSCSAFTKYELIYNGKNYGAVHAEYV